LRSRSRRLSCCPWPDRYSTATSPGSRPPTARTEVTAEQPSCPHGYPPGAATRARLLRAAEPGFRNGHGHQAPWRPCPSGGSGVLSGLGRCIRPSCVWTKPVSFSAAPDLGSALRAAKPRWLMAASELSRTRFPSAAHTMVRCDVIARHRGEGAAPQSAVAGMSLWAWPGPGGCCDA